MYVLSFEGESSIRIIFDTVEKVILFALSLLALFLIDIKASGACDTMQNKNKTYHLIESTSMSIFFCISYPKPSGRKK